jgi:hypothetical protein
MSSSGAWPSSTHLDAGRVSGRRSEPHARPRAAVPYAVGGQFVYFGARVPGGKPGGSTVFPNILLERAL